LKSFFSAWQFLTILPFPGDGRLAPAVRWCPAVGLGLGAMVAGTDYLLKDAFGPDTRAFLNVAALAIVTGFLHLDGLGDTADGLLATKSPEERLAIMRDPRIGSFGVAAIILTLLGKFAGLMELDGPMRTPLLLLVPALSRWSIVVQGRLFQSARPGGLGLAWTEGTGPLALVIATITVVVPTAVFAALPGTVLAATSLVVALLVGRLGAARIGGITGDLFGATVEIGEACCWLLAGAALKLLG
jgi:adenosylcobinamide-GDP ribazoletransferase